MKKVYCILGTALAAAMVMTGCAGKNASETSPEQPESGIESASAAISRNVPEEAPDEQIQSDVALSETEDEDPFVREDIDESEYTIEGLEDIEEMRARESAQPGGEFSFDGEDGSDLVISSQEIASDEAPVQQGSIDFTKMSRIFEDVSSIGNDAGSSLKTATIVSNILAFANETKAAELDDSILASAISTVMDEFPADKQEQIRSGMSAVKEVGTQYFADDEVTRGTFEDAGVLEASDAERKNETTYDNWVSFFNSFTAAE